MVPASNPFRGILIGIVIAVPIWAIVFFAAYGYIESTRVAEQRREQQQMLNHTTADDSQTDDLQTRFQTRVSATH